MNEDSVRHILVVDDQDNWRQALAVILGGEGYCVKVAGCYEDAIREIEQTTFDLIVLDVRLVDENPRDVQGVEILRRVKTQNPMVKVVILTGYPQSIREGVLERYGADQLFLKAPGGKGFDSEGFLKWVRTEL